MQDFFATYMFFLFVQSQLLLQSILQMQILFRVKQGNGEVIIWIYIHVPVSLYEN